MKAKYVPPLFIRSLFHNFLWESSVDKVLLTFDDGPVPGNTEVILKKLDDHKAKALFFCVGNNVEKYPELLKQILSEGHTIGNHTLNHKNVTSNKFDPLPEIRDLNDKISQKFGVKVNYFRPPHGRFNFSTGKLINSFEMKTVMWTLLTYDFRNDMNEIKKSAAKYLDRRSVVVLHDSLKSKDIIANSIDYIMEKISEKGFIHGTAEECLK